MGALQHASLSLDSVSLPGLLRVRDAADEAAQRSWFSEGDLIAAEVKRVGNSVSLLARGA